MSQAYPTTDNEGLAGNNAWETASQKKIAEQLLPEYMIKCIFSNQILR